VTKISNMTPAGFSDFSVNRLQVMEISRGNSTNSAVLIRNGLSTQIVSNV